MSFAHPLIALAAALSVAIPILIHLLLRFRRRPVPWAAMRFLIEAYEKQRRKLRLQQLLLLAARCLLLLAAGVAIARPLAGDAAASGAPRDVYLLIDNSLTSQLRDNSDRRALDRHIESAEALLASLGASDRAALVPLAGPPDRGVLPPSADIAGVESLVSQLKASDAPADLEGALERVRDAIDAEQGARPRVVVFSEFRRGLLRGAEQPARIFAQDASVDAEIRGHAGSDAANVQIADVEPQRSLLLGAGERETVRVRLRRFGPAIDQPATSVVRITHAGTDDDLSPVDAGRASAQWAPGQSEQDVFVSVQAPRDAGGAGALLVTIDRDRLPGDNTRSAPLAVAESARVGVIDRPRLAGATRDPLTPARWLELALQPDRSSRLEPAALDPIDLDRTSLAGIDSAFLLRPDLVTPAGWDALAEFVAAGRALTIFPPPALDAHPWTETAIERLDLGLAIVPESREHDPALALSAPPTDQPFLRMLRSELDALLEPVRVFRALPMTLETGWAQALLTLSDGSPWCARARAGESGEVVLFASALSLEASTLPATPLMVPLVQELVRESAGASVRRRVVVAGERPQLPPSVAEIQPLDGGDAVLAASQDEWAPLYDTGVYRALGARAERLGAVSVVPAEHAGDTRATPQEEITAWLTAAGLRVEDASQNEGAEETQGARASAGLGVSATILLIALALALLETFMARRFSPAGTRS